MKQVDYEHFGRFLCPHTLSARGDDLYFCVNSTDFGENKYRSDLYVLHGGKSRRLTSSGDVGEYRLLDSGVVFASLRKEEDKEKSKKGVPLTVLQKLPFDGGEAQEFLRLPYTVTDLCFLSETRFFFTAEVSRNFEEALASCGGDAEKAAERLKEDADYRVLDELPFRFNGRGYINGLRNRLFLFDGGTIKPLTDADTDAGISAVSPDGKKLWYIAAAYKGCRPVCDRLFELDTENGKAADVSVCGDAQHFRVCPLADGRAVVLAVSSDRRSLNDNGKAYLLENGKYRLLYGGGEHDFYNSVGSDVKADRRMPPEPMVRGNGMYFPDTLDDSTQIIRLDADTGKITPITGTRGNITDAVLYRDGFAMIAMRGGGGSEVYSVSPDGSEQRLTDFNTALCAEYAYSAPQDLCLHNGAGDAIRGWVIPPVGLEPGKKYPAILDVHGGPRTVYGNCYFHEMQFWANRGYAVIFCNPTGGDGKGDRFADIYGHYGEQDFRDIMDFVDEAVRKCGFIDAERMGVTGGSYGGFMTNWIIGHTNRFKAAASQRSISDWISYYGTADIGYFFTPDQTGGDPWNGFDKIWAQSPLKYADRVVTPTLFLHSEEDYRCPLSEGMQMFCALRARGVPARMCVFKGENHELSRSGKPKHRVRRLKEITEWFDRYLKNS